jgi:hypothetical protein
MIFLPLSRNYFIVLFFFVHASNAQILEAENDSINNNFIIVEGDSLFGPTIDLDPITLFPKVKYESSAARRRYLTLKRKTHKVYPYAKLASDNLTKLNERLAQLKRKSQKKKYAKTIEKYLEGEFKEELQKFTITEGQILITLIHRQTGITAYDLIKSLRSGWKAFWYNNTAKLFDMSLKEVYNPSANFEHYCIEDILQRAFADGDLEAQDPAFEIDYFQLRSLWLKKGLNPGSASE